MGAGQRLKQQVDRGPAIQRRQLRGDVRQTAVLCRSARDGDQPIEPAQDGGHGVDRFDGRVDADHRVTAAEQQPVDSRQQNAAQVVGRMVWLKPHAQHAALAQRVAAAGDVANLAGHEHEILVAHQFGRGRGDFGHDRPVQLVKRYFVGRIVQ